MSTTIGTWKTVGTKADTMTRRELADVLLIHPDSVSRNLRTGLGAAVLSWGGRGEEQKFSKFHAIRWHKARACARRKRGAPCWRCDTVLDDCNATAEHLLKERHGVAGCSECRSTWELIQPCGD